MTNAIPFLTGTVYFAILPTQDNNFNSWYRNLLIVLIILQGLISAVTYIRKGKVLTAKQFFKNLSIID